MALMVVSEENGSVITEFMLVLPLLLLILFGILQIIFLANARIILQNAAFTAARSAAVYPNELNKARAIVLEETQLLPLAHEKAKANRRISIIKSGGEVRVRAGAEISLLPLIKQAVMVVGGNGGIKIAVTAIAKQEPYLGQE